MIDQPVGELSTAVAVLTPIGGDGGLAVRVLAGHGITAHACADITQLGALIDRGVGVILVAEEALRREARAQLIDALDAQPVWSDVPLVLLLTTGELSAGLSPGARAIVQRGNVTLLERPVRVATLTAALEAALRGRSRQYEMRDAAVRRARAERQVRDSEEVLRAAIESAPYPLMVHASDGEVVHLSRTWTDLTGYAAKDLRTVQAWVDLAFGEQAATALEQQAGSDASGAVSEQAAVWEREVRTKDGTPRLWSFRAANLGGLPDGRGLRLVAAVDVTDMRRLLRNERELRAMAEEANLAKMRFLATMSHELRTPLNAIGGHAQLMELEILGPVTEQQADALKRVRRAEGHLLGLINDVLNFAKIEAGRVTFDLTDVSPSRLLDDVEPLIEPQVRAKSLTYERLGECADAKVVADVDKARQVLLNLLSNAVKFTEPGGRIIVQCEVADGYALMRVRDTGIGIPARLLDSMFEPFVQVRAGYSGETPGTGLGLAISRDLARAMDGDLTAESEEGVGSSFTFSLPLVKAAPEDA